MCSFNRVHEISAILCIWCSKYNYAFFISITIFVERKCRIICHLTTLEYFPCPSLQNERDSLENQCNVVSEDLRGLDEDFQGKCEEVQKLREEVVRIQTLNQEQRDRIQEKTTEVKYEGVDCYLGKFGLSYIYIENIG